MAITIKPRRTDHKDAAGLLARYLEELRGRLGGFDEARSTSASAEELAPPDGHFVVLYEQGRPVACGGIKRLGADTGEVKRMFVGQEARRLGHGKRVLDALEAHARQVGWPRMVLDTAAPLAEAQALYRAAGYHPVPAYNDNPYAAAWFEKDTGSDFGFVNERHPRLWAEIAHKVDNSELSHDRYHMRRVYALCLSLGDGVGLDPDLAGAVALVHDLAAVPKESTERTMASAKSALQAAAPLEQAGYGAVEVEQILGAVRTCSWSSGLKPEGVLGQVLQDADRLDAMGATGIARTLTCAQGMAARGRRMRLWDPEDPVARTHRALSEADNALDHFLVKLLKLKEGIHLPAARKEAGRRHQVMLDFLEHVIRETST